MIIALSGEKLNSVEKVVSSKMIIIKIIQGCQQLTEK